MIETALAESMLLEASQMNPGAWVDHSRVAGDIARRIAQKCGMEEERAYVMGLLHDIGRREGVTSIRHIFDGYRFLLSRQHADEAAICLTHSFPVKDASTYNGRYDCPQEDMLFLEAFLQEIQYDDYHLLIQLCDALALPHGPVLIEKRLVDVVMRHGVPDFTQRKWQAFFDIKKHFDEKAGGDIYGCLPGIRGNTFA